jgi:hypothetical protein
MTTIASITHFILVYLAGLACTLSVTFLLGVWVGVTVSPVVLRLFGWKE